MATSYSYSDLDLDFDKHPITGDVTRKFDADAIRRSVRNIILTRLQEKPFDPYFGSDVTSFLFAPNDAEVLNILLRENIENALGTYEPRVALTNLSINNRVNEKFLDITIEYTILASAVSQTTTLSVSGGGIS